MENRHIAAREKAQFTTVFGSMVADRLADTITVFILLLLTLIPARRKLMNISVRTAVWSTN